MARQPVEAAGLGVAAPNAARGVGLARQGQQEEGQGVQEEAEKEQASCCQEEEAEEQA